MPFYIPIYLKSTVNFKVSPFLIYVLYGKFYSVKTKKLCFQKQLSKPFYQIVVNNVVVMLNYVVHICSGEGLNSLCYCVSNTIYYTILPTSIH